MPSVTKGFEISYGHRLPLHPGKCARYHGHNGNIEVKVTAPIDKETGMVMDFGDLSHVVKSYLDIWDHRMILQWDDPMVQYLRYQASDSDSVVSIQEPPTAENLARLLQETITPEISAMCDLQEIQVTWWETEDSYATVSKTL